MKYGLFLGGVVAVIAFWCEEFPSQITKGELVQLLVTQALTAARVGVLGKGPGIFDSEKELGGPRLGTDRRPFLARSSEGAWSLQRSGTCS